MKYLMFINYMIRHKWYVFIGCCRYGVPWQGITHDLSKFLPDEFIAYADYYYDNHISFETFADHLDLDNSPYYLAWLIHQKRNRHHWQWWILQGEDHSSMAIPMPDKYIKEMVADWQGAGRAQGEPDTQAWYQANKHKMILHLSTRNKVEQLLQYERISDSQYKETATAVTNLHFKSANNLNLMR